MNFFEEFRDLSAQRRFENVEIDTSKAVCFSNPVCGDEVAVRVELQEGRLSSYSYKARGCWPLFGCLEYLGYRFLDAPAKAATSYPIADFLTAVEGVPASKRHAFSLAHRGLLGAVTKAWAEDPDLDPSGVGPLRKERV